MERMIRRLMGAIALAVVAPIVAGCSSDNFSNIGNINVLPKTSEVMRPDWLSYSGGREEFNLRPVGPADLVGPEGQCAATAEPDPNAEAGAPALQGGISLQMSECEVVRRAGAPERVEMGANERGERAVVLTYSRGVRPGIYRFASGRLVSIERGPEPANARPQQKAPAKKRA
jgi:hypothetical protein